MCYTIKNKMTMYDCSPHPEAEVDLVWKQFLELPPQVQVGPPCSLPKPKPSWGLEYCNDGFQVLGWFGLGRGLCTFPSSVRAMLWRVPAASWTTRPSTPVHWNRHHSHWNDYHHHHHIIGTLVTENHHHHQPTMYLYRHTGPLWVPPSPKLAIAVAAHRPQSARLKDLFVILAVKGSRLKRDNNFCSMSLFKLEHTMPLSWVATIS